jgi:hypothetical protein
VGVQVPFAGPMMIQCCHPDTVLGSWGALSLLPPARSSLGLRHLLALVSYSSAPLLLAASSGSLSPLAAQRGNQRSQALLEGALAQDGRLEMRVLAIRLHADLTWSSITERPDSEVSKGQMS